MNGNLLEFHSDVLLQLVGYLNVADAGRLAETCPRMYYLVHQYRLLKGPELVTAATYNPDTKSHRPIPELLKEEAIGRLQTPPNLVLAFGTPQSDVAAHLLKYTPDDAVVVGSMTGAIQVTSGSGNCEYQSRVALMYLSLPDATVTPFSIETSTAATQLPFQQQLTALKQQLLEQEEIEQTSPKAMILCAVGQGAASHCDRFVSEIQGALPSLQMVGGICHQGFIKKQKQKTTTSSSFRSKEQLQAMSIRELSGLLRTLSTEQQQQAQRTSLVEKTELDDFLYHHLARPQHTLQTIQEGIFGVILGGAAPVRTMVSRGVESVTSELPGKVPQSTSPYVIQDTRLLRPGDEEYSYLFGNTTSSTPVHLIQYCPPWRV